jgi:hypothetical protein
MLTAHRLRKLLAFDKKTGLLHWRVRPNSRIRVGSIAGSDRADGARKVTVEGKSYLQHRLIIFYLTGRWPAKRRAA